MIGKWSSLLVDPSLINLLNLLVKVRAVELQAKAGSVYFSEDPVKVASQMVDSVPMRRYGSINEVIGPVLFLLSDDASYLTGIDIKITGGE